MNALFDALSDPTRRMMLALLAREGELCVCELSAALEIVQPKISRHLAVLRDAGWVLPRREGTWMHYRLSAVLPSWAKTLVDALLQGGVAQNEMEMALTRLAGFSGRPARISL